MMLNLAKILFVIYLIIGAEMSMANSSDKLKKLVKNDTELINTIYGDNILIMNSLNQIATIEQDSIEIIYIDSFDISQYSKVYVFEVLFHGTYKKSNIKHKKLKYAVGTYLDKMYRLNGFYFNQFNVWYYQLNIILNYKEAMEFLEIYEAGKFRKKHVARKISKGKLSNSIENFSYSNILSLYGRIFVSITVDLRTRRTDYVR